MDPDDDVVGMAEVPRILREDLNVQQHGKGLASVATAIAGALLAHWPAVEAGIRDVSGITATISAVYAALYFRRQWKKS